MDLLKKEVTKTIFSSIVASLISFILVATFVSRYFDMNAFFLIKVLIGYYIFNYLVSSVIDWMGFILITKKTMVILYESIIHKFYDSIQDNYKRNMNGSHRDIIQTSIEDEGLSMKFRIELATLWASMVNHGIQQRLMSSMAWKEAFNRYRYMHPDHFSKEENELEVFVKGTNPTWKENPDL